MKRKRFNDAVKEMENTKDTYLMAAKKVTKLLAPQSVADFTQYMRQSRVALEKAAKAFENIDEEKCSITTKLELERTNCLFSVA